jgi:hypothetical protein
MAEHSFFTDRRPGYSPHHSLMPISNNYESNKVTRSWLIFHWCTPILNEHLPCARNTLVESRRDATRPGYFISSFGRWEDGNMSKLIQLVSGRARVWPSTKLSIIGIYDSVWKSCCMLGTLWGLFSCDFLLGRHYLFFFFLEGETGGRGSLDTDCPGIKGQSWRRGGAKVQLGRSLEKASWREC